MDGKSMEGVEKKLNLNSFKGLVLNTIKTKKNSLKYRYEYPKISYKTA